MDAFYQSSDATVYCGRWEDILPALDVRADAIVTDPPYEETAISWDTADLGWVEAVHKHGLLSRRGSIWVFGSMRYLFSLWREMNLFEYRYAQELVWEKHNGSNMHADRFRRVHEMCAQWYVGTTPWADVYKNPLYEVAPGRKSVVRRQRVRHWSKISPGEYHRDQGGRRLVRSVVKTPSVHGSAVWPCQKPLELVKLVMEYSCPEKGLVLDMHMGSGTTLLAARELGMRAIGIDKEREACEVAVKRLQEGK